MSDESKPDDPDRAAILARRQHFIAIALSGLATTGCASTAPGKEEEGKKGDVTTPTQPKLEPTPPEACLMVVPTAESETGGETSTTGGETSTTGGETGGDTTTGDEPRDPPQVCLKKAPPKTCLKQAAPRPCLNVAPSDD